MEKFTLSLQYNLPLSYTFSPESKYAALGQQINILRDNAVGLNLHLNPVSSDRPDFLYGHFPKPSTTLNLLFKLSLAPISNIIMWTC